MPPTPTLALALGLACLLNLALALGTLGALGQRGPTRPAGLGRVFAAAASVTLASLLEAGLLLPLGLHPFGAVHLAWLQAAVVVPLTGALLLLAAARGRVRLTRPTRAAALLSLLVVPLTVDAYAFEPFRLVLERVQVPLDPARAGHDPLRIAVLADLQCDRITDHEREAFATLAACHPDLVLVPGDLFQGRDDAFAVALPELRALLTSLTSPGGTFVVVGNTDRRDDLPRLLEGTGARLLDDEVVRLELGDRRVALLGVDSEEKARAAAALWAFESAPGTDELRLVLSHRPRVVEDLSPSTRIDLVVAGHTHGGQIVVPLLGPPLTLSPLPRSVGAGGLHELDGRRLYVSRGVGVERLQAPPVRLNCPPEVTLLILR